MVRVSSSYCNYEGSLAPSVFFFPLNFFLSFFLVLGTAEISKTDQTQHAASRWWVPGDGIMERH